MAGLEDLYARGLISDDVLAGVLDRAGPEQRPSRSDILASGLDRAKDYLAPSYLRDTPSSPQADRALADPNARPGKIGPPSGPPTIAQMIGGFAGDVAANALPGGKLLALPPAMLPRFYALVEKGESTRAIANELGIAKSSVDRQLAKSNLKTAAAENPAIWDDPGNVAILKAGRAQGLSDAEIARKIGTSKGNISSKRDRLRAAGDMSDYVPRSPSFWDSPEKMDRLEQLGREGYSLSEMARDKQLDALHTGQVSQWIKGMQERHGRMLDYAPQGGTGITAAGRTPTVVQTKTQARPITPEDLEFGQDFSKALSTFLPSGPAR